MKQTPSTDDFLLKWRGDILTVTLELDAPRKGRAAFRTNIGRASVRRGEIIAETENGETPLAKAWTDIPMPEVAPGVFRMEVRMLEVGIFSGKACFFPEGSQVPEWPEGRNLHVKVESSEARCRNSIYTVFPRQFGSFREICRRLPLIMDTMGFRIIQTLPPFPVPTSYAVMGEYGCPFAATDFLSVDPAMGEFDEYSTPLMQFAELIGSIHAHNGLILLDLPANHTGWASTLQTHHPDWFHRETDGRFVSPGAWGVKWADLVELDYTNAQLRSYMADVFLFWCRKGVDGFRCDAGYKIPAETWEYIVAKVREEYPDTIFMLEGLGGDLSVTDRLLAESNLDWAYSELFQTYDRGAFEWYLPQAIARSEKYGTLVHFAETHDNDRLAKGGHVYARLRVKLAALLSWQGAWGIANGVEWYCREKIDVHGRNDLNWGAQDNMVELIARLNRILSSCSSFIGTVHLRVVTRGEGNTLAVLREGEDGHKMLVLANLDCGTPVTIDWNRALFSGRMGTDILQEESIDISRPLNLGPGEVRCIVTEPQPYPPALTFTDVAPTALVHIVMPRDARRDVIIPAGEVVEVKGAENFRIRVVDQLTGKTECVFRSMDSVVRFRAPKYTGDGTRCRPLELHVSLYHDGAVRRIFSRLLVPPPPDRAKVKLQLTGDEVREHPEYRTILSNGAGAAAQIRIGWGMICSQYDAILSANSSPDVPADRINIWARTRSWLHREGYCRELDCKCVTRFTADPAGNAARWEFVVPCGMGLETAFSQEISLVRNENIAILRMRRVKAGPNDALGQVRLVMRPDLEWRSFHETTKAFKGAESLFLKSCGDVSSTGLTFCPYGEPFVLRVSGGEYHHEMQWAYNIPHPEELGRGQEGAGDLFSPGWISADLAVGDEVTVVGAFKPADGTVERLIGSLAKQVVGDDGMDDAERASHDGFDNIFSRSLQLYLVRRSRFKTVIAGYPWFLDWGRDTFIFMRGMIAVGMLEDSLAILNTFSQYAENGTLPNIIYGDSVGNRDTTDAQLWFIRCVNELSREKHRLKAGAAGELVRLVEVCNSIVDNYIKGTPNGIRVDEESALVWSPSHFTWMDTNYPACTPRVGYPVEIQALWIDALRFLRRKDLADRALRSVKRYFKAPIGYHDCLAAPDGEPASRAKPENTIRPNQLFLVSLDVIDDKSILEATEQLLVPGGIRSLNSDNQLYRGAYAGDEDSCRKPAYHNGSAWGWVFPTYAEAMVKAKMCSAEVALQFLSGCVDAINSGCIGHLAEIADGDSPHAQKGCAAQAWSDSELLRVWLMLSDYGIILGKKEG